MAQLMEPVNTLIQRLFKSHSSQIVVVEPKFIKLVLLIIAFRIIFDCLQIVSALHYLQTNLKVMHRDVKPSNVLVNRNGMIKMCDFGISGRLVDSVAKTIEAGSKPYMAVSFV